MNSKQVFIKVIMTLFLAVLTQILIAQNVIDELNIIKEIKTTSVKSQGRTGTCWSFGTTSFIESELIRMGKKELELSEIFTIRCMYQDHAEMYVRYHGNMGFHGGAEAWDLFNVIKKYGIVPRDVYPGLIVNPKRHDHREMDKILKAIVDAVVSQDKLSNIWQGSISGVLDTYLGNYPTSFEYKGKQYSPESFRDYLGIDASNYCAITSYTHHPYYTEFVFESPDNWSNGILKNVELNDIIKILDNALLNGYSVVWAADVSDPGFSNAKGLAIVPEKETVFDKLIAQKEITPELRQKGYDNYETTDDHLMHIVGLAKDKNGTKYYKVKNSWGADSNSFGGFFYASEAYIKLKTMSIAVHKDIIPEEIMAKFK